MAFMLMVRLDTQSVFQKTGRLLRVKLQGAILMERIRDMSCCTDMLTVNGFKLERVLGEIQKAEVTDKLLYQVIELLLDSPNRLKLATVKWMSMNCVIH